MSKTNRSTPARRSPGRGNSPIQKTAKADGQMPGDLMTLMRYIENACSNKVKYNIQVKEMTKGEMFPNNRIHPRRLADLDSMANASFNQGYVTSVYSTILGRFMFLPIKPLIPREVWVQQSWNLNQQAMRKYVTVARFNEIKRVFRFLSTIKKACADEEDPSRTVPRLVQHFEMGLTGTFANRRAVQTLKTLIQNYETHFE